MKTCEWCAGRGWVPSEDHFTPVDCPACHGERSPSLAPVISAAMLRFAGHCLGVLLRIALTAGLAITLGCPLKAAAAMAAVAGLTSR